MAHVGQKHLVLIVDRLPVVAVEFWIVEGFALNAPVLTIDLRPLGARIDAPFQLGHIQRTVADFYRNRTISRNDSPTGPVRGLVKESLTVVRERICANAF